MADEILALERNGSRQTVLFLYPIAVPVVIGGSNVVPTPATNADATSALPAVAEAILTAQEKIDLDAGTLAYEVTSFSPQPGITGPQILAKVQAQYALLLAEFNTQYAARWEFSGQRFNAV